MTLLFSSSELVMEVRGTPNVETREKETLSLAQKIPSVDMSLPSSLRFGICRCQRAYGVRPWIGALFPES